jgi:hypothetical protein
LIKAFLKKSDFSLQNTIIILFLNIFFSQVFLSIEFVFFDFLIASSKVFLSFIVIPELESFFAPKEIALFVVFTIQFLALLETLTILSLIDLKSIFLKEISKVCYNYSIL